jgi:hypothetical protein
LPTAYHSWVLTTPWAFVAILRRLIEQESLGPELRQSLLTADTTTRFYDRDALVHTLTPPIDVLGPPDAYRRRPDHEYRFWTAEQIAAYRE